MKLDDVNGSFIHVYCRGKNWSVVDLACTPNTVTSRLYMCSLFPCIHVPLFDIVCA